ncbi:ABC transporter permease [Nonomuraea sp. NPDC050547]|uniref:ABC transporter permease n=1 Tax=Nonomuraea sp. NPDC050547 TaxID=3364368 RepID=UPI003790CB44
MTRALTDSATMLRRQLRHILRYPALTLTAAGMPIIFLVLFVYVFGGTMGAGIDVGTGDPRTAYANYLAPGIILMTVVGAAQGTAISVATDMTGGIVARFKTMAIARVSVLTGHVLGSIIQTMLAVVAVVAVALLVGFRPGAGVGGWLGVAGVLVMISFAITWLSTALGMVTDDIAAASNLPMPLIILPFLGSGFVPTASMPDALRWFAENQPFTPIIETLRGLLTGAPVGDSLTRSIAWSAVIALLGYLWAKKLYNRDPGK